MAVTKVIGAWDKENLHIKVYSLPDLSTNATSWETMHTIDFTESGRNEELYSFWAILYIRKQYTGDANDWGYVRFLITFEDGTTDTVSTSVNQDDAKLWIFSYNSSKRIAKIEIQGYVVNTDTAVEVCTDTSAVWNEEETMYASRIIYVSTGTYA